MNLSHVEITYILQYGYLVLFPILVASELLAFAPVGILLIALGALARAHYLSFTILLIVSTAGSVMGDYVVFHVARKIGKKESYRRFVQDNEFISRIEHYMQKYPHATISLSRLIGFAGVPVNAIAGLSGISVPTFLLFDTLGDFFCCLVYLLVGYYVGAAWEYDSHLAAFLLGAIFAFSIAIYFGFYFFLKRRK